jgi:hypothetical protein
MRDEDACAGQRRVMKHVEDMVYVIERIYMCKLANHMAVSDGLLQKHACRHYVGQASIVWRLVRNLNSHLVPLPS